MKKVLLIIAVIAVLSGCTANTKTLTCTSETKSGNITSKTKYMIDYDGNDVKKLTATYDYKDNHTDGVGTGTDGTTSDKDPDSNGIVDGVVGEALDDVVTGVTDTILDISGIKTRHNTRFGSYTNTEGFTIKIDNDNDNDYTVTYTYDLTKLTDTDITNFGISRDFNTLKKTYTDRGLTCK